MPATPAPAAAPGKPASLPPTTGPIAAPTVAPVAVNPPQQSVPIHQPAPNGDVLLIPRWVYVPYSPHQPNGPTKLPANLFSTSGTTPYMTADERMTVLPPMGASAAANTQQTALMEQFVKEMKAMNQRMIELEAKAATRTASAIAIPAPPAPAPIPAASVPAAPQMLPLPPLPVPMIPPAK